MIHSIDLSLFSPTLRKERKETHMLYVGKLLYSNSLEQFLEMDSELGRKIVIGDGPNRKSMEAKYPHIEFVGYKDDNMLAWYFANTDVVIFPTWIDTRIMVAANACGTPIVALPFSAPKDFVVDHLNGVLGDDLEVTTIDAIMLDRERIRKYVEDYYTKWI